MTNRSTAQLERPTSEIKPYHIDFPDSDLDDLRERIARTRWPDELPGAGWSYGIPLDYVQELAEYWRARYDWRKHEAHLNQYAQFTTTIDGANVHFFHVKSPEPNALPLIMTHGWPTSNIDFIGLMDELTDPKAHGGNPADAFHVVAPAIPGFGLSGPTHEKGWHNRRVAEAWLVLMARLGYERFGAYGYDWGGGIARMMGAAAPGRVVGVHASTILAVPTDPEELKNLTKPEQAKMAILTDWMDDKVGYGHIQSTRPQTIAYGLTDSPVAQMAWLAEKFKEWTDSKNVPEDAVDRDQMLTNITLYWLTRTAGSSARMYWEAKHAGLGWGANDVPSQVPMGVTQFKYDAPAFRRVAERTNNIVQWSEFDRGGHFAVLEEPDLVLEDVRKLFRKLR